MQQTKSVVRSITIAVAILGTGLAACAGSGVVDAQPLHVTDPDHRKLVLVSIDGLRWQEVFRGADSSLAANKTFTKWQEQINERFIQVDDRAGELMPFINKVVSNEGILIGNRDAGSCARVTNNWWFSYPGYNEMLTGKPDNSINSNASVANPNVTILEWLNRQVGFRGQVHAFGSWNVFPFILNEERSGIPVNAGFEPLEPPLNDFIKSVNRLQQDTPSPWDTVRLDAYTHHYALETLRLKQPRVLYIAYGETDDFAHDGRYDQYLFAAHRTDRFLQQLWTEIQNNQAYVDRTTLIITVDHGRGELPQETWQHHASGEAVQGYISSLQDYKEGITGSDQIWIAAIGPGIQPAASANYDMNNCAGLNQVAASALKSLRLDWQKFDPDMGSPLQIFPGDGAGR